MGTFLLSAAKHALSANRAAEKVMALEQVLTRYYPRWRPYDGTSAIQDVQTALAYVASKKYTKTKRKAGQATASTVFGAAGAAIGGAAGSVVLPGAGSALGAVTVGSIVSAVPTVGVQLFRKGKFLYKTLRGTQGVHRKQAATALHQACKQGDPSAKDTYAAAAGVLLILGEQSEFETVMADPDSSSAIDAIAKRLKSW